MLLREIMLISFATIDPNHKGHQEHKDSNIIVEIFFVPCVNWRVKECMFKDKPGKGNNLSGLLLGEFFPHSPLIKVSFQLTQTIDEQFSV